MTYRHYSFDVWLTLIRSNPAFRRDRMAYFAQHLNPLGLADDEVDARVREVDITCTRVNELVGKNIDSLELILLMANRLGVDLATVTPATLVQRQGELTELFRANPPLLTDEQIPAVLTTLRSRGATLSLLSNTGLIQGAVLRDIWQREGIDALFAFQLYSDEVHLSKPNPAFYALLFKQARQLPEHQAGLQPTDILHVGDNPVADREGAESAGLRALLIDPITPRFAEQLTP